MSNFTGGIFGVVHLRPLPGDPRHDPSEGAFEAVYDAALADAAALVDGGVDGLVVENFGSAPFAKGTRDDPMPPEQLAALAVATERCRRAFDVIIGVNALRNDARAALGIAAACAADFVRINVHTGAFVTDQGLIEGEAHRTLRERSRLRAERVAIVADVLVKHARPLVARTPEEEVHDAFDRGLADAVVVTGTATGAPVDRGLLERVRASAGERPVLIGSGLSATNVDSLAPLADGAIIGTAFKRDGDVRAPVDADRVRALVDRVRSRLRAPAGPRG